MAMRIENQAVMFALLCKYTVEKEGSLGNHIIQQGMIKYGKERGRRMAERACTVNDYKTIYQVIADFLSIQRLSDFLCNTIQVFIIHFRFR